MRRSKIESLTPHQVWLGIFVVWAFFLTGIFTGRPGMIQALRLRSLLGTKKAELSQLHADIVTLQNQTESLQKNPVAQEREIRRVLGYAAPDELIFDFGHSI